MKLVCPCCALPLLPDECVWFVHHGKFLTPCLDCWHDGSFLSWLRSNRGVI